MTSVTRIHHLNCGTMQPYGGALFDGQTRGLGPATLACHCLLLETEAGLVLVDTGTVSRDPAADAARHSPVFRRVDRLRLDPAEAAFNQIRALGHDPAGLRHLVMTHLDFDHAAGMVDFPEARVHLSRAEAEAAQRRDTPKARERYRPGQWGGTSRWQTYGTFGADWMGLQATEMEGLGPDILLVSLPGHTKGHCGVAIRTQDGWLLHAADAIFHRHELECPPSMPVAARLYQWTMQTSQIERRRSLWALRRLHARQGTGVEIICTHDPGLLPR
jgi:glyoxylase-like metal-dependent hydrolase (beta-lactamase superfamily II)